MVTVEDIEPSEMVLSADLMQIESALLSSNDDDSTLAEQHANGGVIDSQSASPEPTTDGVWSLFDATTNNIWYNGFFNIPYLYIIHLI